ncbi:hypothetical protein BpHYR1_002964 [Brachionus plicatilis]|uniref:Uncharacterized protein n=1 Tax=Brachionus plicatilis TaxID=10195 RepID=A0A3M7Q5D0_BRAPC|nr:hypothetical protein BpHYR1_002964 [Brachionus plicatilis]
MIFCNNLHKLKHRTILLKQTVNTWCTQTYQCQDYNGLVCLNTGGRSACECQYPRYWNGNQCVDKLNYELSCSLDSECNQNFGLACYEFKRSESESCSGSNPACQNYAGLTCTTGTCRCSSTQYWVSNKCRNLKLVPVLRTLIADATLKVAQYHIIILVFDFLFKMLINFMLSCLINIYSNFVPFNKNDLKIIPYQKKLFNLENSENHKI